MPDLTIVMLVGLITIASIILASSYKRLWKSAFKNLNSVGLSEEIQQYPTPKPIEEPQLKEAITPNEPTTPPPLDTQDKPSTLPNAETASPLLVEAAQQPVTDNQIQKEVSPPLTIEPTKEEINQPATPTDSSKEAKPQLKNRATRRRRSAKRARTSRRSNKTAPTANQNK